MKIKSLLVLFSKIYTYFYDTLFPDIKYVSIHQKIVADENFDFFQRVYGPPYRTFSIQKTPYEDDRLQTKIGRDYSVNNNTIFPSAIVGN